jgi:single-strand DNA-binding protein
MSGETNLTIRGRLTADPELRFTPSGAGVVNFAIASNASKFDKDTNAWKDQPAKFWRCAAWNQGKLTRAENVANLLKKGDSVIVYGELTTREYVTKEGENKVAEEIRVESIGKDLTFHGQAYAGSGGGFAEPVPSHHGTQQPPASQPWGGNQPAANSQGWGQGPGAQGEAPF